MRIGNLEDLEKAKKPETQSNTETPENRNETEKADNHSSSAQWKKWKNRWYYYKWYMICGIILLLIACNLIGSALGLWTKTPDFQIAYIGKTELPPSTVSALEQAFASIAGDFNGDGEIIVRINQYIDGAINPDIDTAYYEYASEISLIGDISDCESYFFLMDNPEHFQLEFQVLASPDGSCPDPGDYSIEDKVLLWADCPALSAMTPDSYSTLETENKQSENHQELLSGLYFGRRCFYTGETSDHADRCSELWDFIRDSR